ncbi:hypothetical protein BN3661_01276 [Eubacteriaceae bacterium CHKCI005]|nr:hypothetical protein BN3661_01276 [Eubacteriaceae bacterium CHKCI005]
MFFVGIALLLISLVLAIGSQVMLALCIYNDAKARGDQNAVLFAVLSGVLGVIPAIIYLVLRSNSGPDTALMCPNCGVVLPQGASHCPNCGMPHPKARIIPPDADVRSKRAKGLLIGWIVSLVLSIVLIVVSVVFMGMGAFSLAQDYNSNSYHYSYNYNDSLDRYLNDYYY